MKWLIKRSGELTVEETVVINAETRDDALAVAYAGGGNVIDTEYRDADYDVNGICEYPFRNCAVCNKKIDTRDGGKSGKQVKPDFWVCGPECCETAFK